MRQIILESVSIVDEKINLRQKVRSAARQISLANKFNAGREIYVKLYSLPEFKNAEVIHTHISSFSWEVSTINLIRYVLNRNGKIIIPFACPEDDMLTHYSISQIEKLKRGCYNIWEPQLWNPTPLDPKRADIIIVPGIAFDKKGNRLGAGGGYYDKFLNNMNQPKIALAYSFQVVDDIPVDNFDHKVDIIITENELIF